MTAPARPASSADPSTGPGDPWSQADDGITRTVEDVAAVLDVDPDVGLSTDEAARRLEAVGRNRLLDPPRRPRWRRFVDQFRSVLNAILAGAALLAAAVGDLTDAVVVALVLVANAVLGYVQEGKAESAVDGLRRMLHPTATVRRDGTARDVDVEELVPGDVVLLEAGDRVPADGRLVEAVRLAVDESALTGESVPSDKGTAPLDAGGEQVGVGDRVNAAYLQTTVARGRGVLVVTRTGMATEMGRIAALLHSSDPGPTPLERRLDRLGTRLALVAGVAAALVLGLRLAQGDPLVDALLGAVALAVAAVPEGLPAVVTVTLAVGVRALAGRNAIVKRLSSVETLGSTDVICSDKTGTLTRNQMTARAVVTARGRFSVSGEGYDRHGEIEVDPDGGPAGAGTAADTADGAALRGLLEAGVLANDADLHDGALVGDPTEGALVVLAAKGGIEAADLRRRRPRLGEVPFDSAAKYMATAHAAEDGGLDLYVKGAPDVVIGLTAAGTDAAWWSARNEELAGDGQRVLAVARRRLPVDRAADAPGDLDRWVEDLELLGLVAIVDPPRAEAARAVARCRAAGIDVKMITGDHAATAAAIAEQLGIRPRALTGAELDRLADDELEEVVDDVGVFARVSPEHKVRVVAALQARGHTVAMTGDGVNDAPALTRADIGVAMGITGTEVSKDAADMVLADDDFATIVGAVERGRAIFDNIVAFVRYQLATNLGAIGTILGAGLVGLPAPLTAIQVLFVNLLADGPPAMTLGVDPPRPDVMDHPPRPRDEGILTRRQALPLGVAAVVMTIGTLGVLAATQGPWGEATALTATFTTFVLFQVANVFVARADRSTLVGRHTFQNGKVWVAAAAVVAMQVAVVHVPVLQRVFDTVALTPAQWALAALVASSLLVVHEVKALALRLLASPSRPRPPAAPGRADGATPTDPGPAGPDDLERIP